MRMLNWYRLALPSLRPLVKTLRCTGERRISWTPAQQAQDLQILRDVDQYLKLGDEVKAATLQEGVEDLLIRLQRTAALSDKILPFLYDIRRVSSQYSQQSWAPAAEKIAYGMLQMLSGPAFVHVYQLSCSPFAQPHIQALADAAKRSETVHKTSSHVDYMLKYGPRRMVHCAFHTGAPTELLAVLYSALLPDLPSGMPYIDERSGGAPPANGMWTLDNVSNNDRTAQALTTAAFYSVSAPHLGTKGLKLGSRIIYTVAGRICRQCPQITHFTTLSPVPGFVDWVTMQSREQSADKLADIVCEDDAVHILQSYAALYPTDQVTTSLQALAKILRSDAWFDNPNIKKCLQPALSKLCRNYLLHGTSRHGQPDCKVASFHLGNGAQMKRICWGADTSAAGIRRSASLMVNYVYSETGYAGLETTQWVNAPAYAADPRGSLARQNPTIITC
jgi:hypothetical protein